MRAFAIAILAVGACAKATNEAPTDGGAGDTSIGDDGAMPDAMPTARTWKDDAVADFTGTLAGAVIEAPGSIVSSAYYTGGLLWRASNTMTFDSGANTTWATVSVFTQTGKVAVTRSTSLAFGADTPPSVGLTDPDTFSMWFEGEVYLDAGTHTFEILVDDHGFVELAPSPTAAFQRVASCDFPTAATGTFVANTANWYPIRFAASEGAGESLIQLRVMGPNLPTLQPIPRHRLRATVSGITGLVQSGFDDGHLLGDVEHTIDQVTPTNTDWNTGNPGDLGMTASDDFSVRWSGQLRIDVAGTYTFRYVTDDGQRLWIDGQRLLDAWDDTTHDQTTSPITLTAGWHDIVVDQTERGGGAIAVLYVASGPELANQTLPLDRLRPVEGRQRRWEGGVDRTDRAIPDLASAPDSTVVLTAPTGATVAGIDVSYSFSHTYWSDVEIRLVAPNGATALIRDNSGGNTSGVELQRLYTTALDGAPVAGTWGLRATDTIGSDTGTLLDFQITTHYAGGEAPIAPTSTYESQVKDLGADVDAITRIAWVEQLSAGSDIAVRMRTCATQAACASEAWSAPITDPAGGVPAVMPRQFAQYRVEITTNGTQGARLDELSVSYTTTD
ncbi:MAG: PA14 domain-containing protein [Kofleriaceae bacterium]